MDEFQSRLASNMKIRREAMNMSQEKVADYIDKSPSLVGQLERKETLPSLETLDALIHCLGIDANELFAKGDSAQDAYNELHAIMLQLDEKKRKLLTEFARFLINIDL